MTEKYHLKIKWKDYKKTEAIEIVLYDDGHPMCELISVDDARLVRNILNEQEERIQRLKAQLECGEDVCRICKHTYLVPSREYYIAQCKKGHSGCSKGTVDYCDDFELKW